MGAVGRTRSLLWRHRKWWLGPLIVTVLLFALLWLSESGTLLPSYIYQPF